MLAAICYCLINGSASEDPELHPVSVACRMDGIKCAEHYINSPRRKGVPIYGCLQLIDEVIKVGTLRQKWIPAGLHMAACWMLSSYQMNMKSPSLVQEDLRMYAHGYRQMSSSTCAELGFHYNALRAWLLLGLWKSLHMHCAVPAACRYGICRG